MALPNGAQVAPTWSRWRGQSTRPGNLVGVGFIANDSHLSIENRTFGAVARGIWGTPINATIRSSLLVLHCDYIGLVKVLKVVCF
jgi:hypothetical protein